MLGKDGGQQAAGSRQQAPRCGDVGLFVGRLAMAWAQTESCKPLHLPSCLALSWSRDGVGLTCGMVIGAW